MTTISVIIPTYNCGKYIGETIESVLNQKKSPLEILIIDDGSTDNTEAIVRGFNRDNIFYIKQKNAGVSAARNNGLSIAKGDYIAFLDADDLWKPDMLEKQASTLDKYPDIVLCFTNFVRFIDGTKEILPDQFRFYPELNKQSYTHSDLENVYIFDADGFSTLIEFGEFPGYTQAILFRKTALMNIKFNEKLKICEDAAFVLEVAAQGKAAFNTEILLKVRRHDSNATKDISLMAVDKLNAINYLNENLSLSTTQHNALRKRTLRAIFDAALALARKSRKLEAVKVARKCFEIKGFYTLKIKRIIKLVYTIFVPHSSASVAPK